MSDLTLKEEYVDVVEDLELDLMEETQDNSQLLNDYDLVLKERNALISEIEILKEDLFAEKEKNAVLSKQQMFEKIILQAGGRNVTAILSLIEQDLSSIEESDFVLEVKRISKAEPYLFLQKEDKVGGTGFKNSKGNMKNITSAFKSGLGI